MKTLNQIGKDALTRIFKPVVKIDAMTEFYRSISFPNDEFDVSKPIEVKSNHQHYGNLQFNSSVSYKVWGIELGLVHLKIENGQSILDAISELKELPSHLIVLSWSNGDMGGEHEDYTVYRFSSKQDAIIRNLIFS